MDNKFIEAITKLLQVVLDAFGPGWSIVILLLIGLLFFGFKVYTNRVKANKVDDVVKAKDQTIEVLAQQNRDYRVLLFKEQGFDDDAVEQLVLNGTPQDPVEARKLLQNIAEPSSDKDQGERKPQDRASKKVRRRK